MSQPTILSPLTVLPGVSGRRQALFNRLLGQRVIDALFHLPSSIQYRRHVQTISESHGNEVVTLEATIIQHIPSSKRGHPHKVLCHDGATFFHLIFFNGRKEYLQKSLPLNEKRLISGKAEKSHNQWSIIHPDFIGSLQSLRTWKGYEPIYPLTTGITNKCVRLVLSKAQELLPDLPEWHDPSHAFPSWKESLCHIHQPTSPDHTYFDNAYRERLAYDEFLAQQLAVNLIRIHQHHRSTGKNIIGDGLLQQKILSQLPFELTRGQKQALEEIQADMASSQQMLRLLQGDVGSGKTLVALLAMVRAIEAGYQAALLAPTDILARQHLTTIQQYTHKTGIEVALLTGREKGRKREALLDALKDHRIHLLIGTHALIQDTVIFSNLGLAVVDEQHRFGVEQRLALTEKGHSPDILSMTATPIPRTLALANYGDMDISILQEKPAGRQPIITKTIPLDRLSEVISGLERLLNAPSHKPGHTDLVLTSQFNNQIERTKIYWVCPLIEESESVDLAAAQERFEVLKEHFGDRVGLVHGKMPSQQKDFVMTHFSQGNIDILVATTVIEVGVNVPEANIMVIEHAERFGLAQLHQLRGRIGRGNQQATCLLLFNPQLGETGRKRLAIMRETTDGFKIAEEDFRIRGSGEALGTRQSGFAKFRLSNIEENPDRVSSLLAIANKEAKEICRQDPYLQSERGKALRILLRLFGKDEAIKYSRSG
jgi:ATP-dependent DNA helicase RecG